MENVMPELQNSLVNKCIKKYSGDKVIGKEYKKEVSKALTIYLHYIHTIGQEVARKKKGKTVNIDHLQLAFSQLGFEDIINDRLTHTSPPKHSPPSHSSNKQIPTHSHH